MNDKEFNKGIEELKNISLSKTEKEAMLSHISAYADFHAPKQKPEKEIWFWSFMQTKGTYAFRTLTALLIISGTVYGAENALPGDLLYPFKVNVNESVRGALISDPEEKIQWESDKFIRRVEEAEALASKGKLDQATLLEVETRIDKHFETFDALEEGIKGDSQKKQASVNVSSESNTRAKNAPVQNRMMIAPQATQMSVTPEGDAQTMFAQESTANLIADEKQLDGKEDTDEDEFETRIRVHKATLEKVKQPDRKEQNERIERLERKLDEKVFIRNQKNMRLHTATSSVSEQEDPTLRLPNPLDRSKSRGGEN